MKSFTPTHLLVAAGILVVGTLAFLRMAVFTPGPPDLDTRTYALEALAPHEAEAIVAPYVFTDRPEGPGHMTSTQGAITVRETPDNLDKIARVLAEFDGPRSDIRLHFQLVEAGDFQADDDRIASVEEELRGLFDFRGYRLAGEAYVTVTGMSSILQTLSGGSELYEVRSDVYRNPGGGIRLDGVSLAGDDRGVGLTTTVNIRPGQTLVLGSSNTGTDGNTLFLTVRAASEGE